MSMVINLTNMSFETQSHRTYPENWNGEGWLPVPLEFEQEIAGNAPYIELKIENDSIIGVKKIDKPTPKDPEPTTEERLSALESAMLSMMGVNINV